MSEQNPTVQEAFDPELRHAQADFDTYLQSRPYTDENGKVHDPQTGDFVNADNYFDRQRQASEAAGQTPYEDMSMPDLARKLAEAEHHGDRTMEGDVHQVLHDKIMDKHRKTQSVRDVKHNAQRLDNLVDRVMSVKDKELERLQNEAAASSASEDSATPDEDRRPHKKDGAWIAPEADGDAYPDADDDDGKAGKEEEAKPAEADEPTPITEQMPIEEMPEEGPSGKGGEEPVEEEAGRWARFKKGVRKHLYESPIIAPEGYEPMTPMGPVEPQIPFEQWYAERHRDEFSRQRRILAGIGALAAAGVLAAGIFQNGGKGGEHGASGIPEHPHQNVPTKVGAAKLPGTPEAKTTVRLKAGSNPWVVSEQQLRAHGNAHPTPAQIEEIDKKMAELNPDVYSYSGESSKHIPVGTELKVPKL